jgi:hypothetical protein
MTPLLIARMAAAALCACSGSTPGRGRHEPCRDPATPGDDDFLAGLHPVEQLAQLVLGLEGSDLAHDPLPIRSHPTIGLQLRRVDFRLDLF